MKKFQTPKMVRAAAKKNRREAVEDKLASIYRELVEHEEFGVVTCSRACKEYSDG